MTTWKSFVRHLPPEDQVEWEERPQTAQDVLALIRNIQSVWLTRPRQWIFARSMSLCDRFVPAVETHTALLAVLPDAEVHYVPLFHGALQTVLKVGRTPRSHRNRDLNLICRHPQITPG